jgi:hypothetical protein
LKRTRNDGPFYRRYSLRLSTEIAVGAAHVIDGNTKEAGRPVWRELTEIPATTTGNVAGWYAATLMEGMQQFSHA